jgi:hypothetical protein
VSSRTGEGARNNRFFWLRQIERLAQDFVLERLFTQ